MPGRLTGARSKRPLMPVPLEWPCAQAGSFGTALRLHCTVSEARIVYRWRLSSFGSLKFLNSMTVSTKPTTNNEKITIAG